MVALLLQNKLGEILSHSHIDCLPLMFLTAECYLFWWHPYLWQEHSWIAAIPQMEEEEALQVTWALISQTENGHLDIHSYMRSKRSWIKSFISPVIDKHPEENGISGKRKEAALYWVCMWLWSLRRTTRARLPWPFPLGQATLFILVPLQGIIAWCSFLTLSPWREARGDCGFCEGCSVAEVRSFVEIRQKTWVVWAGEVLLPFSAPEQGEQYEITGIFQGLFPLCFVLFAKGGREPCGS